MELKLIYFLPKIEFFFLGTGGFSPANKLVKKPKIPVLQQSSSALTGAGILKFDIMYIE
tara:strand:- start:723 stop:899 length:177 start_codon:yes stop_codon:yes gene_type:complete